MAPSLFYVACTWIVFLVMIHTSLATPSCHPDDRSALMEFKGSFRTDYPCVYPKIESWSPNGTGDCCSWNGVGCDEATGHVTSLDLSNSCLIGTISLNTSLFRLRHLESLNLAWNDFNSSSIPFGFGNLSRLQYLNFSDSNFFGKVPSDISLLSKLTSLDLSYCYFSGSLPTSLGNLSQLTSLDVSYNKFHGQIPTSFANLTQLSLLDISANNFTGDIRDWLGSLSKLNSLYASGAQLSGQIPSSIKNLTQLVDLSLSQNNLQGEIPNSLWELEHLEHLFLGGNNLSGTVDLHKLKNLFMLDLESNNISFVSKNETNVMLPFLYKLSLRSCNLHEFPKILDHLVGLEWIDLSHNKIEGSFPTWMGNGSKELLRHSDLSHKFATRFGNNHIDLPLPKLHHLDISSNLLKTKLLIPPPLAYYNVSNNFLFGDLQSICEAKILVSLDLSRNDLSGTIPQCIGNEDSLPITTLSKSKEVVLEDMIYRGPRALRFIDLRENRLQGPIPKSLANCAKLEYLDLGYNQIVDEFPSWLSNLTDLQVLVLKSNKFYGPIETYQSKFNLSNLHIMDISKNNFNGELPPQLFQSFHAMKVPAAQESLEYMAILSKNRFLSIEDLHYRQKLMIKGDIEQEFFYGAQLVNKGVEREYLKVPVALMLIDLSSNKFEGHVPDLIGDLKSLVSLNLSNNIFSGFIPPSLANLTNLESLDLSQNNLSGEISQQLARLTSLSIFNVSRNQLSGPIPQGNQFSTFPADSFSMNEGLCGSPLPKKCTTSGDNLPLQPPPLEEVGDESLFNLDWKTVVIGNGVGLFIGFLVGILIIDEKSGWFLYYSKEMAKRLNRARRH